VKSTVQREMNSPSPPSSFGAVSRIPPPTSEMTQLGSLRTTGYSEQGSGSPDSPGQRVKIVADYALQQRLGSGSFAVVYKGVRVPQSRAVHETVAVKAISRTSEKLTKKVLQNLEIEINILRSYRHRNIVCMHDVQKTEHHFYLILEFCSGGDVQKLIRTRQKQRLTEGLTRRLMRDLSSGLRFLWGQELIHRDIKPQNLLLTGPLPLDEENDPAKTEEMEQKRREANYPTEQYALKIADFGFARHLQSASLAETLCGSPLYMYVQACVPRTCLNDAAVSYPVRVCVFRAPEILQHHR
jgi:serine/threonine protein kinase